MLKRKQISLLTLAPDSWIQQKVASYFNVKLYSVRKAASPKKEHGMLSKVTRKKGHQLNDVLNLVKQFYKDNEYSRMCPGAKEYKSVTIDGVKRKKQKTTFGKHQGTLLRISKKIYKQLSGK